MNGRAAAQSINRGMSTVMLHRAYGRHAGEALKAVRCEAARLERVLSRFIPGSEISRINRSAGIKCERISGETYEVLEQAIEFSSRSQGVFDVTIGPLTALWNSCRDLCRPPEEEDIRRLLPLVDYTGLILDPCKSTACLKARGQAIDLGGIGKGFAGDKLLGVFREYGVSSAFTNIGGNVAALGAKPDGSPWRVGVRHPRQDDSLIGYVSVTDRAVVTSGDYQRYFIGIDGKRYHHILDPATGYPSESGLNSVTVVAGSSLAADALSTILFAAGMKKGMEILKAFPDAEAIFVGEDLRICATRRLKDRFQACEGIDMEFLD